MNDKKDELIDISIRIGNSYDYNLVKSCTAFSDPDMSRLDIIDKNEYIFYAITL